MNRLQYILTKFAIERAIMRKENEALNNKIPDEFIIEKGGIIGCAKLDPDMILKKPHEGARASKGTY